MTDVKDTAPSATDPLISVTGHPACVHRLLNARKVPAVGWVKTSAG